jgi:hypothetical protein
MKIWFLLRSAALIIASIGVVVGEPGGVGLRSSSGSRHGGKAEKAEAIPKGPLRTLTDIASTNVSDIANRESQTNNVSVGLIGVLAAIVALVTGSFLVSTLSFEGTESRVYCFYFLCKNSRALRFVCCLFYLKWSPPPACVNGSTTNVSFVRGILIRLMHLFGAVRHFSSADGAVTRFFLGPDSQFFLATLVLTPK